MNRLLSELNRNNGTGFLRKGAIGRISWLFVFIFFMGFFYAENLNATTREVFYAEEGGVWNDVSHKPNFAKRIANTLQCTDVPIPGYAAPNLTSLPQGTYVCVAGIQINSAFSEIIRKIKLRLVPKS